ncbi:MAG: gliding motility protein GldM [Flavobacteriales bacterium]|nr:gliding motility protein GldM [Flavobacteriales bacterium]
MAGANLTPRQKMINLMYLVFVALLALNISKDILDAFLLVNNGLETTYVNYDEKNLLLYSEFDKAKTIDPKKVTPYWEKATQIKTWSQDLSGFIDDIKAKLIMETEKLPREVADTINMKYVNGKDNYDAPTRLMIGDSEDGSKGWARELKLKINQYEQHLLSFIDEKERSSTHLDLKTSDVQTPEGKENWEMNNFYHTPLAATVTLLSKLKTDVKNAEFEVVNKLFQSVRKNDFTFDTIAPRVITPSNYVMLGQNYDADIFVAAFSKTQDPEILIGKLDENGNLVEVYDTVHVKDGMGKYSIAPSAEGMHEYEGIIKVTSPSGVKKKYPFHSSFIAAKPSLVVSPDAMNVLYVGPDNPISVSVPGVASENITATITGTGNRLTKTANGKYKAVLSKSSPKNVQVNVSVKTPKGETQSMGNMNFVVKRLPTPYASFADIEGDGKVRLSQIKNRKVVKVTYGPDFVFTQLPLSVEGFKVEVIRGNEYKLMESCPGRKLSDKAEKFFDKKLQKHDVIYITDIFVKDVSGSTVKIKGVIKIVVT